MARNNREVVDGMPANPPQEAPPVFPPVEATSVEEEDPSHRNWLMLGALIVAALAFAILVGMAAVAIYHHAHKPAPQPQSSNNLPKPPPTDLKPDNF